MPNDQGTFVKEEEKSFSRFYRFSKWYVTNRELLKKIGYGVFITVDAVLILFVLWTAIDTYLISYQRERQAVAEMVAIGHEDLRSYTQATSAEPLSVGSATVLSLGDGQYDFYATLTNPNPDWWAEVTYQFASSGEEEPEVFEGFILPSEEKPIVALGVQADSIPRSVELELVDVEWRRVDRHLVGDYDVWVDDRLNFEITDATWTVDGELEDPIGRVSFTVQNDSAYSYYDPVFYALLTRGARVVGVNRISLSSIDAYEELDVEMNWFGTLPSVSQVEIVPEINIFDLDVYKPLQGETTTDTRTRVFERR